MTTVVQSPTPILQFFDNRGAPNAGGAVLTQVGGINYPTYQDAAGAIPLPNPIPLNSRGEISNASGTSSQLFLDSTVTYSFIVQDASGNVLNVANSVGLTIYSGNGGAALIGTAQGITVQQSLDDLRNSKPYWAGLAAGSANALTLTVMPAFTAYQAGQRIEFIALASNTGIVTANISALGILNVKKNGNGGVKPLIPGDIQIGGEYTLIYDGTQLILKNPSSQAQSAYSINGLIAANNTGTPNSQLDINFKQVTVQNSADFSTFVINPGSTITNDITVSGLTLNGRDQVGAFSPNSFVHFYLIYNPTTLVLGSISSAVAPPSGPSTPSGFTCWAYVGGIRIDGSGNLASVQIYDHICYKTVGDFLPELTATIETTLDVSAIIPLNAVNFILGVNGICVPPGGGNGFGDLYFRLLTGVDWHFITVAAPNTSVQGTNATTLIVPNIGQKVFALWKNLTNAGQKAHIFVLGYTNP